MNFLQQIKVLFLSGMFGGAYYLGYHIPGAANDDRITYMDIFAADIILIVQ